MKLSILGSGREVGRSAILLQSSRNILLDCGIAIYGEEEAPAAGYPKIPKTIPIHATIIAHAHLDHSGFLPMAYKIHNCPIFGTPPTFGLSDLLIKDAIKVDPDLPFNRTDLENALNAFIQVPYEVEHTLGETTFTLHDAGHIPGSAITEINTNGKKIVYTSDFKDEETRLQKKATQVEDVDVLIIESTYSYKDHPSRKDTEKKLLKRIDEVIENKGNVLLPAFAVGRTQELSMILYSYNVEMPSFIDGMGRTAAEIMIGYPKYTKKPIVLREAIRNMRPVGREKHKPLMKPSVIVSTAGMLDGGPAIGYLLAMNESPEKNAVLFTGFCAEGTNGWFLQNKHMIYRKKQKKKKSKPKQIDLPVGFFHLSSHAGKSGLLDYIKKANPEKIIIVHGEFCEDFASELKGQGWDAIAPKNGESIGI